VNVLPEVHVAEEEVLLPEHAVEQQFEALEVVALDQDWAKVEVLLPEL
jgi:hypothetical protein